MSKLLPCPFCGFEPSESDIEHDSFNGEESHWVWCWNCDCRGPECATMEDATVAWNKRRTDGFFRWIDGELGKLKDGGHPQFDVRSAHRRAALLDCRKQLRKLLDGMGVQESR